MTSPDLLGDDVSSAPNEWCVEIVAPDGTQLKPTATLVELISTEGQIGVMPGHERLMAVLELGELVIHNGRQRDVFFVGGGFVRVQPGGVSVLAFTFERAMDDPAVLEKCSKRRRELIDGDESCDLE